MSDKDTRQEIADAVVKQWTPKHTQRQSELSPAPCSVEDGNRVAILASRQDLADMILALEGAVWNGRDVQLRCKNLATGMRQLFSEAFPPNDKLCREAGHKDAR